MQHSGLGSSAQKVTCGFYNEELKVWIFRFSSCTFVWLFINLIYCVPCFLWVIMESSNGFELSSKCMCFFSLKLRADLGLEFPKLFYVVPVNFWYSSWCLQSGYLYEFVCFWLIWKGNVAFVCSLSWTMRIGIVLLGEQTQLNYLSLQKDHWNLLLLQLSAPVR